MSGSCCHHTGPGYATPLDAYNSGDREKLIYVPAIVADASRPDYLATVDVDDSSPTFGQVVHRLPMPFVGDELHHSGWNACSSCFGDSSAQRKFLILPGVKSGRIYAIDVRDPRAPKVHKYVDGEAIAKATGLAYPHTSHCLGDGSIMVSMMGNASDSSAAGDFLLLSSDLDILGTYAKAPTPYGYDFWYQPHFNTMVSTEFGAPSSFILGFNPAEATSHYGHHVHVWNFKEKTLRHSIDLGADGLIPLEVRFAHDPMKPWGYVGAALSSNVIYLEIDEATKGKRRDRQLLNSRLTLCSFVRSVAQCGGEASLGGRLRLGFTTTAPSHHRYSSVSGRQIPDFLQLAERRRGAVRHLARPQEPSVQRPPLCRRKFRG